MDLRVVQSWLSAARERARPRPARRRRDRRTGLFGVLELKANCWLLMLAAQVATVLLHVDTQVLALVVYVLVY